MPPEHALPAAGARPDQLLLLYIPCPDQACAQTLAQAALQSRLCACANILAPCTSLYHWQGALQSSTEIPLLLKTLPAHEASLRLMLQQLHPYDTPAILAWRASADASFIEWVELNTSPT